jgi:hypothetical protein
MFPFLQKLFADGGYQGPQFANAVVKILPSLEIEIVRRPDAAVGFTIVPKRWIVTVRTMLPSWRLSGPRSSNADEAVVGGCFSLR